jgi:predicted nucleic acid-binding protein
MSYLADTNVVVRWALPGDPQFPLVRHAVLTLRQQSVPIYVTAQVLLELQALATRPLAANGLGLSTAQASSLAQSIEALFPLLPETAAIYPEWRRLVDTFDARGRQVYDARLVAVMLTHGVTHLLTLNPSHFRRFAGIQVVEPHHV